MGAATVAAAKTTTSPLIFCTLFVVFFQRCDLGTVSFSS